MRISVRYPVSVLIFCLLSIVFAIRASENKFPDMASFKDAYKKNIFNKAKDAVAKKQKEVNELKDNPSQRPSDRIRLQKAEDELKKLKKSESELSNENMIEELQKKAKETYESARNIMKSLESNTPGANSFDAREFFYNNLNPKSLSTYTNAASKGVDYYTKMKEFQKDLQGIKDAGYAPEIERMAGNLYTLSAAMSEWGANAPIVGEFLKGYGDITKEFLSQLSSLKETIEKKRNQSLIGQGTYGKHWDERGKRWDMQNLAMHAYNVPGFRDLYMDAAGTNKNIVYLWDPDGTWQDAKNKKYKGVWLEVGKLIKPGSKQTVLDIVVSRYKTYHEAGNSNPSAQQIIYEFRNLVNLVVDAPDAALPGSEIELKIKAFRAVDRAEVTAIEFKLTGEYGDEGKKTLEFKRGEKIVWKTPSSPGNYSIKIELAQGAYILLDQCNCYYYTGAKSNLKIAVKPSNIKLPLTGNRKMQIRISLRNGDGEKITDGKITVSCSSGVGAVKPASFSAKSFLDSENLAAEITLTENIKPGKYSINAEFSGYANRREEKFFLPASANAEFAVEKAPPPPEAVAATDKTSPQPIKKIKCVDMQFCKYWYVLYPDYFTVEGYYFLPDGRKITYKSLPIGENFSESELMVQKPVMFLTAGGTGYHLYWTYKNPKTGEYLRLKKNDPDFYSVLARQSMIDTMSKDAKHKAAWSAAFVKKNKRAPGEGEFLQYIVTQVDASLGKRSPLEMYMIIDRMRGGKNSRVHEIKFATPPLDSMPVLPDTGFTGYTIRYVLPPDFTSLKTIRLD